jgi:hypothetical protein
LRRRRPTPGAQAPWKADFNRREGLQPAVGPMRRMNSTFKGPSADGRPAPTGRSHLRRRRPTPGAQAPWKADFNRREGLQPAVGPMRRMNSTSRSACADREIPFASAKADARRASALDRFQSAAPAVGPSPICVGEGRRPARKRLRPTTGLRRLKERKMPTSRLSHRRAPRVHRFGPELIGRATLTGQRETSGQTGSGSPPDNSIIPGEDPTACGRLPRARPLPPSRTERDGFVRRAGKAGFPCPSDIPGLELVEGLK